jgi:hypothetical protein
MTAADFLRVAAELGILIGPVSAVLIVIMQAATAGKGAIRQVFFIIAMWQVLVAPFTLFSGDLGVLLHNATFLIPSAAAGGIVGLCFAKSTQFVANRL